MLTDVAPVTLHNRVDVLPTLMVDGLLLNSMITGGVPTGGIGFGDGAGNVKQPGMRISSSSDKERKTNLFNVCTSKNMLPETSTCPYSFIVNNCLKLLIRYVKYSNLFLNVFLLIAACY